MATIYSTCILRRDLASQGLSVPIGESIMWGRDDKLEYRWVGVEKDVFQVRFEGRWLYANSIDFDFPE